MSPRVVGLDLSLAGTGYADDGHHCDTITTAASEQLEARLRRIVINLDRGPLRHPVDLVVIEDFVTRSPAASLLGMVHGAVRLALYDKAQPFVLVPPASLKKYATGKGNATKPDMRMALYKRIGEDIRDDNAVDAWWLRAMGLDALGHPLVEVPKANREALAKVEWPEVRREAA